MLVAALLLFWQTWHVSRKQAQQEQATLNTKVDNLAQGIGETIEDYRLSVRLFAQGHMALLRRIAAEPGDQEATDALRTQVLKQLPNSFGVTLARPDGQVYYDDFDGYVSPRCQADIRAFAHEHKERVYIHPNPAGYHFDIMTAVQLAPGQQAIFFVSFLPSRLVEKLAMRHSHGYLLAMLNTQRPGLIEFTEQGVRHTLQRKSLFLDAAEQQAIVSRARVPHADWELVALRNLAPGQPLDAAGQIWRDGLRHLLVLLVSGLILLLLLWRTEKRGTSNARLLQRHSLDMEQNSQRLQRLQQLSSDNTLTSGSRFQRVLELGCEVFGKDSGVIARVDNGDYLVQYCVGDDPALHADSRFRLDATFARDVVTRTRAQHDDDIAHGPWHDHPARATLPALSYLGTPILLGGQVYGVLDFLGHAPSTRPTSTSELDFLQLLAQWISYELGRRQDEAALHQQHELMAAISRAQSHFIADAPASRLFTSLLKDILALTDSEFGYLGEVVTESDGTRDLHTHATAVNPDDDGPRRMLAMEALGQLQPLFEQMRPEAQLLVCNAPAAELPEHGLAHSPDALASLLVVPLKSANRLIGVLALANRPGGYATRLVERLELLLGTCGNLLTAYRAAQTLAETQRMQRAILSNISYLVIATDLEGTIIAFNPAAEAALGYGAEEVLGLQTPALFHDTQEVSARAPTLSEELGEPIKPGFEVFVAKARRGEEETRHWTYIRRDGSRFTVQLTVTAVRDESGLITGFLGVARDITEEQAMIESLRQSEARLADAQRIAHYGNWEWNIRTNEAFWSDECFRIFGHEPQSFKPDHERYLSQLHPEDRDAVEQALQTALRNGSPYRHEHRIVRPDDSVRIIQDRGEVKRDSSGQIVAMAGTLHDITELRHVERLKAEFISTVSHELRTPLTSIQGSLGLLTGGLGGELSAQASSLLEIAHNNVQRLLLLINDILDLSKIESGKLNFHFRALDIMPFIEQAIAQNQPYAEQYAVQFILEESVGQARVRADSDRLMQVMSNLLSNAAKFTRPGTNVEISVHSNGESLCISVRDHGNGIPESFHEKIFDKFSQADSSDTRRRGGTGLGLNIARSIIEAHGGRLDFDTRMGEGTTFYFELPLLAPAAANSNRPGRQPALLICEDDPQVADSLQRIIAEHGFAADIAYSAAEARTLLASRHYLAMTLDLLLPDENGIDLLKELRESPQTSDLPIIIVSAVANDARREFNGNALYILDWLDKPFEPERLLNAVDAANRQRQSNGLTRILHVEDDDDVNEIVRVMLRDKASVVHETDLHGARRRLAQEHFDLVLLDIALPDGNGLSLLDDIHQLDPSPAVIIFSALELDIDAANNINAVLIKSRTGNQQLLETILSCLPEHTGTNASVPDNPH